MASGRSTRMKIPYGVPTDPANVDTDVEALATGALDTTVPYFQTSDNSVPTPSTSTQGAVDGQLWWCSYTAACTDGVVHYGLNYWDGAAWNTAIGFLPLATNPAAGTLNQVIFNTTTKQFLYWSGSAWTALQSAALNPTAQSGSYSANDRDLVLMTGGNPILLPTPTAGRQIGAVAAGGQSGSAQVVISTGTGTIAGLGVPSGATSIPLGHPGATVTLSADGSAWNITAGAQDSGYVQFDSVLTNGYAPVSAHVYWRLIGNAVRFNGSIGSGASGATWLDNGAAVPANPPTPVQSFLGVPVAAIHAGVPGAAQTNFTPGSFGVVATMYFAVALSTCNLDMISYLTD